MSLAWGSRLSGGSLAWGAREASATVGIINGTAVVSEFVEYDLTLVWQVQGGVTADLSLLWQLDASPITAVESDLSMTWNIVVAAGTTVEADLGLLWQIGGSVTSNLFMEWHVAIPVYVASIIVSAERNSVVPITAHADYRVSVTRNRILARVA